MTRILAKIVALRPRRHHAHDHTALVNSTLRTRKLSLFDQTLRLTHARRNTELPRATAGLIIADPWLGKAFVIGPHAFQHRQGSQRRKQSFALFVTTLQRRSC